MADPYMANTIGDFAATYGADTTAGDALYFDGTNWVLADADDNTKFAEAFAAQTYKNGERGVACFGGLITDTDAPFTQGDSMYLSATAGAITATRPTGAENLMQVLGFCISTSEVKVLIAPLHEETINLQYPYQGSSAPQDNDNEFYGIGLDDTSAVAAAAFMCPQNMVELAIVYSWHTGTGTALDATDTVTIDVSGGIDDETTSANNDQLATQALTVAANDIAVIDITAGFNASALLRPGNLMAVNLTKAVEGSSGDDPIMCCTSVVVRCV